MHSSSTTSTTNCRRSNLCGGGGQAGFLISPTAVSFARQNPPSSQEPSNLARDFSIRYTAVMHFFSLAESLTATKNPLYRLHDRLRDEGHSVLDLVRGNVNDNGIVYPPEVLEEILREAAAHARIYRPDSFGQPPAREAIAAYQAGQVP